MRCCCCCFCLHCYCLYFCLPFHLVLAAAVTNLTAAVALAAGYGSCCLYCSCFSANCLGFWGGFQYIAWSAEKIPCGISRNFPGGIHDGESFLYRWPACRPNLTVRSWTKPKTASLIVLISWLDPREWNCRCHPTCPTWISSTSRWDLCVVDQTRSTFNYDNPVVLRSIFFCILGGRDVAFE
jgi:hypothetical protein